MSTTSLLLIPYVLLGLGLAGWGLSRRERVLQFPFLTGVAWLGFLLPQILGVLRNRELLPEAVWRDGGPGMAIAMYIGCGIMAWIGYQFSSRLSALTRLPARLDPDRIFLAGCALVGLAFFGYAGLARLSGGFIEYFTPQGNYSLRWTGLPVRYNFFVQLVYPGLACCLLGVLRKPSLLKWAVVVIASLLPLAIIIFLGRRTQAIRLLSIVTVLVFFIRGWLPPRPVLIAVVGLLMVALFVAPEYREHSQIGGNWSEIGDIDVTETVSGVYEGREDSEFENASVIISAYHREFRFNLGKGFYNRVVAQFIPAQIVGAEFKKRLLLDIPGCDSITSNHYGWIRKRGSVPTGPGDAFREFWLPGMLTFLLIGSIFRGFWSAAMTTRNETCVLLYALLLPLGAICVTGNVTGLLPEAIYYMIFVLPAAWLASMPEGAAADTAVASEPAIEHDGV